VAVGAFIQHDVDAASLGNGDDRISVAQIYANDRHSSYDALGGKAKNKQREYSGLAGLLYSNDGKKGVSSPSAFLDLSPADQRNFSGPPLKTGYCLRTERRKEASAPKNK
jgi:hypothetical protein